MVASFDGDMWLSEQLHQSLKSRWIYHNVETMNRLAYLRRALETRCGNVFVIGAWEIYANGEKFRNVEAELQLAHASEPVRKVS